MWLKDRGRVGTGVHVRVGTRVHVSIGGGSRFEVGGQPAVYIFLASINIAESCCISGLKDGTDKVSL